MSPDRAARWVVALSCLLLVAQVSLYWYATRDGASYVSIGRSLARSGTPTNLGEGQLFFAPGYSFLIAPLFWIDDRPFLWLSLVNAALGVVYLCASRAWFERLGVADAWLLAATSAINASAGILLRRTLSEALFMPALMIAALLLERVRAATSERVPAGSAISAGCVLAGVCLTRQAGLTMLPGFAVAMVMKLRAGETTCRRALAVVVLAAIPPIAAVAALGAYERSTAAENARTYADYLIVDSQSLPAQFVNGAQQRISEIGRITVPGMFKASSGRWHVAYLNFTLFAIIAAVIASGWWRAVSRSHDTLLWTAPFYVLLYVLWPFPEGNRFLTPLAPVWFLGLYQALPQAPFLRHRVALLGWTAHVLVAVGYWLLNDLPEARGDAAQWPAVARIAAVIDADAGLVAWLPPRRDHERLMLQIALDRRVIDAASGQLVDRKTAWLVTEAEVWVKSRFTRVEESGEFAVWRRDE